MNRGVPVALMLALAAGPAAAEEITVRSGEHAGFSRLVLEPQTETGWTLGRIGRGYELRLDRPGVTFGLDRVFDLIPRTRLAAITPGSTEGSVALGLSCDCRVTAFETAAGVIVVDVADGAPDPASPFEARLDAGGAVAATAQDRARTAAAGPAETVGPEAASTVPDSFALLRQAADRPLRIPYLDAFWTDPSAGAAEAGKPPPPAAPEALAMSEAPVAPPAPDGEAGGGTGIPAADGTGPPGTAPALPLKTPETAVSEARAEASPDRAVPAGAPEPGTAAGLAGLPDPRVLMAERDLLVQLSRAATQGLIVPSRSGMRPPATVPGGTGGAPDAAPHAADGAPAPGLAPTDDLAIRAETSIDRVIVGSVSAANMTGEGRACPPAGAIDVAAWGRPDAPAAQIADLRRPLVGEFDRPDAAAAAALARLYLYLGFGAEAVDTLDAFGVADDEAPFLRALAAVMDDAPGLQDGPLADLTDCGTGAALWAVLSKRSLAGSDPVAYGAVLQGFSALPMQLRQHLGPRLARLFIAQGKPDVARGIRNAIARGGTDRGETLQVIDAELELSRGNRAAAETLLDAVAARGSLDAPAALRDAIRSRLDDGRAVDARMAGAAMAYGFELGATPLGRELQELAVLALASDGRFTQAFDEFARLGTADGTGALAATRQALAGMLIDGSDDATFLGIAFGHRAVSAAAAEDPAIGVAAARRLLSAALPREAERLLATLPAQDGDVRRLRARAALADDRAGDVTGLLEGMEDAESLSLRAEAEARQGRHGAASALFGMLGDSARSGSEAWRAGNLGDAAKNGPEPVRAALQTLGTDSAATEKTPPADTQVPPALPEDAPLSGARAMIEDSRRARQAITDLLAALQVPEGPAPASPQAGGAAAEPTR